MTTTFILKEPEAKGETLIFLVIRVRDERIKIGTRERITPTFWNKKARRVKESYKFDGYKEFNTRLDNIERKAKDSFRRFQNDHDRAPSMAELKDLLSPEENKPIKEKNLFGFIDTFIAEAPTRKKKRTSDLLAPGTITIFKRARQMLLDYQTYSRRKLDFDSITLDFYTRYLTYLSEEKKLSTNTIGKHIKTIKTFLHAATVRGFNTNSAFKSGEFAAFTEVSESIYLNEGEISEMLDLDLSGNPKLEKVRDLFIVGCWTGLRFSDFSAIEKKNIKNNTIEIRTKKTGEDVVIPLHNHVVRIMAKYKGKTDNSLPAAISNQKMNEYLKEIGKKLETLKVRTEKTITKGGVKITTNNEKWQHLTTHTARRSTATNLYLDGIPTVNIMKLTGHRTEKAFFGYIKITPRESASIIQAHWDKKSKLKSV